MTLVRNRCASFFQFHISRFSQFISSECLLLLTRDPWAPVATPVAAPVATPVAGAPWHPAGRGRSLAELDAAGDQVVDHGGVGERRGVAEVGLK